jgi:catechol 2,3-dioxygenase-like lactoylglutathione lyase family enzyme
LGPDSVIFGVDDVDACARYLEDYGLIRREGWGGGGVYEALDGTSMTIVDRSDTSLPGAATSLREVIYGVADKDTLEAIGAALSSDRQVRRDPDGSLHSVDDDGYAIGFQITIRRPILAKTHGPNIPGLPPGRPPNIVAAIDDERPRPFSLSHVVLFTRDKIKSEAFYARRLGFRTTDYFSNLGPFMRPRGSQEHHTLFLIQSDTLGLQHFTFHFADCGALLKAGWEFQRKGYASFWGPGRHILGSNFFWYFQSPFGALMELDADMDRHDDSWVPRSVHADADSSQTFLMGAADKWSPRKAH